VYGKSSTPGGITARGNGVIRRETLFSFLDYFNLQREREEERGREVMVFFEKPLYEEGSCQI
jgi:hypothetical protein